MHAVWNDRTNVVASRMLASSGQLFWRCVNRSQTRFLAAWRYASAVSATALCPSVRHRPVLYRNCWIYWTHSCTYTLCYNEIRASRKVRALPCSYGNSCIQTLYQKLLQHVFLTYCDRRTPPLWHTERPHLCTTRGTWRSADRSAAADTCFTFLLLGSYSWLTETSFFNLRIGCFYAFNVSRNFFNPQVFLAIFPQRLTFWKLSARMMLTIQRQLTAA